MRCRISPVNDVQIIYASTSGHTEYVVERVIAALQRLDGPMVVKAVRAEQATPEDLLSGEVIVLASGTWNTGGVEGQMNPYMHEFLLKKAKDIDLKQKKVAIIALGDDRYYYTSRSGEHMRQFATSHNGSVWMHVLTIVNDPYGQEAKVEAWAKKLRDLVRGNGSPVTR